MNKNSLIESRVVTLKTACVLCRYRKMNIVRISLMEILRKLGFKRSTKRFTDSINTVCDCARAVGWTVEPYMQGITQVAVFEPKNEKNLSKCYLPFVTNALRDDDVCVDFRVMDRKKPNTEKYYDGLADHLAEQGAPGIRNVDNEDLASEPLDIEGNSNILSVDET